jgi:hypothetical protein
MRALLSAIALVSVFGGVALAEPMKLDEAMLEDVAGGVSPVGISPIGDIQVQVLVPTTVENNLDLELVNQNTNVFAVNTTAVIAAFSSNVSGAGVATGNFAGSMTPPVP